VACDGSMWWRLGPVCRPTAPSRPSEELGSSFPMSSGMLLVACGKPRVAFSPLIDAWCATVQSCMGAELHAHVTASDAACPAAIDSSVVPPAVSAGAIA